MLLAKLLVFAVFAAVAVFSTCGRFRVPGSGFRVPGSSFLVRGAWAGSRLRPTALFTVFTAALAVLSGTAADTYQA